MMKTLFFISALLLSCAVNAGQSCWYASKRDGGSVSSFEDCGSVQGDSLRLNKAHLKNVLFDGDGLACIMLPDRVVFYLHKNGKSQRTYFFDNGCDYFENGRARAYLKNKMVLIDKSLAVVLNPGYERIETLDCGYTKVCNGPFTEHNDGEHTVLTGGQCGLIDVAGALVIEAKYPIEDNKAIGQYLMPHKNN